MRTISDIGDVNGKTLFVRVDFNVPVADGVVSDDFRIQKSLETIDHLLSLGARLILASHIEGGEATLRPVFEYLKKIYPIVFVEKYFPDSDVEITHALGQGHIVLLENLRVYKEEKANEPEFARHLASFAHAYVNEAFSASHREHASIVGIPKHIPSYAGFVFEKEVAELTKALQPEHPFLFILGGAKFETKLPIIEKFFDKADRVFIGGALANDFLLAEGAHMGHSLLSEGSFDLKKYLVHKLILPKDVVVQSENGTFTKTVGDIEPTETISDVGPNTIEYVKEEIKKSKFILWNGPLGNYEKGFKDATLSLAQAIAESGAISIVGGGDTVASIAQLNLSDKFSFISTGGGAMLDFLAHETLPGIEAMEASDQ